MNNDKIAISYISPGWPLNEYPNGIVAYVENIVSGFDDEVITSIIAHAVGSGFKDSGVVDLSSETGARTVVDKVIDKILFHLKTSYTQDKLYQRHWNVVSKLIANVIEKQILKPHIIEVEESFGISKWLVKHTTIPIVTRLHGPWFIHGAIVRFNNLENYKIRVESEGEGIKLSQGITAPSLDVLEKVRDYYDLPLIDAKVIPNPVSPVRNSQQWTFQADKNQTILFIGRFDLHKGGDLALNAFRIIASQNKEVELLFVGPDRGVIINEREYSFHEYVAAFIPEEDIRKRINFLDHCDSQTISTLRKDASITIMTSRYETFSISLAEALAAGSPVVATNVGAIKELVTSHFNGLLAEPESAASIAENVLTLLDDPQKMQVLSRNAIEDSKARFAPKIVAKQSMEFYRSVIADNI
jgi:glycosyltransferase involved in cell wall biosynthesis